MNTCPCCGESQGEAHFTRELVTWILISAVVLAVGYRLYLGEATP